MAKATDLITEDFLTAEDILAATAPEYTTVDAWGKKARIRSLNAGELIEFREANEGPAKRTAGLRLIIMSLVDKDGKNILEDAHLQTLRARSEKENNKVIKAVLKHNGLEAEENKAKNA